MNGNPEPIVVAVAMSLYAYNVAPDERARRLYHHFDGSCMDIEEMVSLFTGRYAPYVVTELPQPTAEVYVQHAMEKYGREAAERVAMNRGGIECLLAGVEIEEPDDEE